MSEEYLVNVDENTYYAMFPEKRPEKDIALLRVTIRSKKIEVYKIIKRSNDYKIKFRTKGKKNDTKIFYVNNLLKFINVLELDIGKGVDDVNFSIHQIIDEKSNKYYKPVFSHYINKPSKSYFKTVSIKYIDLLDTITFRK